MDEDLISEGILPASPAGSCRHRRGRTERPHRVGSRVFSGGRGFPPRAQPSKNARPSPPFKQTLLPPDPGSGPGRPPESAQRAPLPGFAAMEAVMGPSLGKAVLISRTRPPPRTRTFARNLHWACRGDLGRNLALKGYRRSRTPSAKPMEWVASNSLRASSYACSVIRLLHWRGMAFILAAKG